MSDVIEIIGNTTATPNPRPDWNQTDETKADYIKNKPEILTEEQIVALIGEHDGSDQLQTDWTQTDDTQLDYIKNKPALGSLAAKDEVAKTDLASDVQESLNKADSALQNIPDEYITETELANKGYLTDYTETDPTVPSWAKAPTKPTYTADEVGALPDSTVIPGALADLSSDSTHRTVTDAEKEAWNAKSDFSGNYNDLTNKPTIPSIAGLASETHVATSISTHNTNTDAHNDIRVLIEGLTTRLNALANSTDEDLDQMAEIVDYIKNNKTLIDNVTTNKVNVSDIINNLTTNVSNKPLSAAQGVVLKGLIDNLQDEVDGKSALGHTHDYAGSSSAGGSALSAVKLDTSTAGSATQPVYFSGGKPTACTYTLGKSVPSDAEFTDTTYSAAGSSLGLVKSGGDVTISGGVITVNDDSHDHSKYLTAHPTISVEEDSTSALSPEHGNTFTAVDSITRDGNGHVIKVNTKTVTVPDAGLHFIPSGSFTVVAGSSTSKQYLATKWAVSDVDGITNPSDGMSIALRAPDVGYSGGILLSIDGGSNYYPIVRNVNTLVTTNYSTGSTIILTFNSTQTAEPYLTPGEQTEVTGCWQIADYDSNSYSYVRQYLTTTNANYPLLFKYDAGLTETKSYVTKYTRTANNMYVNPSTGEITANGFIGTLTGNASTATKATQDANGNVISDTYATQQALLDSLSAIEAKLTQLIGGGS